MTSATYRPASDAPLCQMGWPVMMSWTSREDGGPTIRLTYPVVGRSPESRSNPRHRAVVEFRQTLYIRYHNEHLRLSDSVWEAAKYVHDGVDYPWLLWRGEGTTLLAIVAQKLATGGGDWFGTPAGELHHYRIMSDHDGYYDVICTGMDITTEPINRDEASS